MFHKYRIYKWFDSTLKTRLVPGKRVLCVTSILLVLTGTELPGSKLLAQNVPTQDLEAASLYQQGVMRYYRKDLQTAENAFRQALERDPNVGTARNYLGNILLLQNRLDGAIQEYTEAIRINPNLCEAYYNLGLTLHKQGQTAAAITSYRQALVVNPTMVPALYNLGLGLYEQGQKQEAIATYQQAINLDSSNANAVFNLAIALQEQGQNTEAIAAYRKFLELNPKNAVAYNNIGSILALEGKTSLAIDTYIKAIQEIPNDPTAYYNLGVMLYNERNFKQAKVSFKYARDRYREQGNIAQADKVEDLVQQIAMLQRQNQVAQTPIIQSVQPKPDQSPTSQTKTPSLIDPLPPTLQQMPSQSETPLQTPGNPVYVPLSRK
ncbi:tetratricopeptide repeat protein [Aetokthonos hydrillicola Thurmond2011]|uniref:Tetratricopeptide repeat protein n=1 Tax=Aetokthonos hydrillicola Thurmond2011 TaxID=2712845 RepID=A0AAP5I666_9CYAN|nr:tetratricopeptide repeat protein [Aetokthonos hydrillicola]MBO3458319.1 tetratricopeptide repeat protein [Aetokthonos hydrillicola CCALA 1050]MBW4585882.1 tetratricopeptide repeat protein [Aetokthonos hydrillicola CCALA 1050]MDR9893893.1 tetratricopeptide repeat protein [Aetokthonos hydrillicola Thurmond2011]